jgi:hypothetical protein
LLNTGKILSVNATPFVTKKGCNSAVDVNLFNSSKTFMNFDGFFA